MHDAKRSSQGFTRQTCFCKCEAALPCPYDWEGIIKSLIILTFIFNFVRLCCYFSGRKGLTIPLSAAWSFQYFSMFFDGIGQEESRVVGGDGEVRRLYAAMHSLDTVRVRYCAGSTHRQITEIFYETCHGGQRESRYGMFVTVVSRHKHCKNGKGPQATTRVNPYASRDVTRSKPWGNIGRTARVNEFRGSPFPALHLGLRR